MSYFEIIGIVAREIRTLEWILELLNTKDISDAKDHVEVLIRRKTNFLIDLCKYLTEKK